MNTSFHIDGLENAVRSLATLPRKIRNRSLRKAFGRGATVCAKAVRRNTPRDTGTAKRNVGKFVLVKGDQDPEAKIGHKNLGKGRKNPAKYTHLMERGAKAHTIAPKKTKALRFGVGKRGGTVIYRRVVSHPGATAQHVIERSFRESRGEAVSTITTALQASIPGDVR